MSARDYALSIFSGSIANGLFLPFVPGIIYDSGLTSPFQFSLLYLAQRLLLSVSKGTAESAVRVHIIGLLASIVVVYNVALAKQPSEIAFVVLALFTWASEHFFPFKRKIQRTNLFKFGNQSFELVETILTFGVPVLASLLFLVGGRLLLFAASVSVMIYNAHKVIDFSEFLAVTNLIDDLDNETAFAVICYFARRLFVEGLNPVLFPGYFLLAFGYGTPYLGLIFATQLLFVRLRPIAFDVIPDLHRILNRFDGVIFLAIAAVMTFADMIFSKSLTAHLMFVYPLRILLSFAHSEKVDVLKTSEKVKKLFLWVDIPAEIFGSLFAGFAYSVFPLTRGMSLNGLGIIAAFALFHPEVKKLINNALSRILSHKNSWKAAIPKEAPPSSPQKLDKAE